LRHELFVQVSPRAINKSAHVDDLLNEQVDHFEEFMVDSSVVDILPDAVEKGDLVGGCERVLGLGVREGEVGSGGLVGVGVILLCGWRGAIGVFGVLVYDLGALQEHSQTEQRA
jgi:hypothetical protein